MGTVFKEQVVEALIAVYCQGVQQCRVEPAKAKSLGLPHDCVLRTMEIIEREAEIACPLSFRSTVDLDDLPESLLQAIGKVADTYSLIKYFVLPRKGALEQDGAFTCQRNPSMAS